MYSAIKKIHLSYLLFAILCVYFASFVTTLAEHECELRNPAQQSECIVFKSHSDGGGPGILNPDANPSAPSAIAASIPGTIPVNKTLILLAGIPGISGQPTLPALVNALYTLLIAIGAIIAVVKITIAGIVYMGSEAFAGKQQAREDIKNAVFGLLIILLTALIIQTIFGNTNLDVLKGAPGIPSAGSGNTSVSGTIFSSNGCQDQMQKACAKKPGDVAIFNGTKMACVPSTNVPYSPGQPTDNQVFKRMTVSDCNAFGGDAETTVDNLIKAGKAENVLGVLTFDASGCNSTSDSGRNTCIQKKYGAACGAMGGSIPYEAWSSRSIIDSSSCVAGAGAGPGCAIDKQVIDVVCVKS